MSGEVEHVTCQELVELLTAYLEGTLDPAVRADVERHIVICRGCTSYVEQMRCTIDLLGRAGDDEPEEPSTEQLLGMFRSWREGRSP